MEIWGKFGHGPNFMGQTCPNLPLTDYMYFQISRDISFSGAGEEINNVLDRST